MRDMPAKRLVEPILRCETLLSKELDQEERRGRAGLWPDVFNRQGMGPSWHVGFRPWNLDKSKHPSPSTSPWTAARPTHEGLMLG